MRLILLIIILIALMFCISKLGEPTKQIKYPALPLLYCAIKIIHATFNWSPANQLPVRTNWPFIITLYIDTNYLITTNFSGIYIYKIMSNSSYTNLHPAP